MSTEKMFTVDTQVHLVYCRMLSATIPVADCAGCEHHKGISEIWPGKGNKEVMRRPEEMTFEPHNAIRPPVYEILCALPTRTKAMALVKPVFNKEVK